MTNGFGGGRGFGRGIGRGIGGGMGFGFRGSSPPWPYVGRGRGGLPRCGYFLRGAGTPPYWSYTQAPPYRATPAYGYRQSSASMTRDEELGYLKEQAEAMKGQLEQIESRIRDMGNK